MVRRCELSTFIIRHRYWSVTLALGTMLSIGMDFNTMANRGLPWYSAGGENAAAELIPSTISLLLVWYIGLWYDAVNWHGGYYCSLWFVDFVGGNTTLYGGDCVCMCAVPSPRLSR